MPVQPRIKGLSDIRRLPRLGKIRLGIKLQKKYPDTGKVVEYPKEVDYFVCPPEVQAVYGERPKALEVMFPPADETRFFPQQYKAYVHQGLRCRGDGELALRRAADLVWTRKSDGAVLDDARNRIAQALPEGVSAADAIKALDPNDLIEIKCPCPLLEDGTCRRQGVLFVILPKISMGGVYQITTGSFHNIVAINSIVDWLRGLFEGQCELIPFILAREPEEIEYEGKKSTHWLLKAKPPYSWEEWAKLRQQAKMVFAPKERLALPEVVDDGPDDAPGAVTLAEEEPIGAKDVTPAGPAPGTHQAPPIAPEKSPEPEVHYPPTKWEKELYEELGRTVTQQGIDLLWDKHWPTIETRQTPVRQRIQASFAARIEALKTRAPQEPKPGHGEQGRIL